MTMDGNTVVAPPVGYLDFCGRYPSQCGPDAQRLATVFKGGANSGKASENRKLFWKAVFEGGTPHTPVNQPAEAATQTYNWQGVFDQIAASHSASTAVEYTASSDALAGVPKMTPQLWDLLEGVNRRVNAQIRPVHDRDLYGFEGYWTLPIANGVMAGDCKDYVLEKRRILMESGIPMTALSIALGTTAQGEYHAVLLVRTDRGEYVLDNLSPWVTPWTEVSYTWSKRQSALNPDIWIRPTVAER
jgi:predicted transglutaminase-like cysteine proteinase